MIIHDKVVKYAKKRLIKSEFLIKPLAKSILLENMPKDVSRLIIKEQSQRIIEDKPRLKKHAVVYEMLREWYKQKIIIHNLIENITGLEKKLGEAV